MLGFFVLWWDDVECISPNHINAHFSPVDCCNMIQLRQRPRFLCLLVFVFATSSHPGGSGLSVLTLVCSSLSPMNQFPTPTRLINILTTIFMLERWQHVCKSRLFVSLADESISNSVKINILTKIFMLERNERGVPNFSYELAEIFWRFPNEFAMIWTRYRLKIVKVGNWPVQMRNDRQFSRLRHHILGYLPSQFLKFRQVAEGTRDRAEISTRAILESWLIRSRTMEANKFRVGSVH